MRIKKSFESYRLNIMYPVLIGSTITINSFFIFYKGAKGLGLDKTPIEYAFLISFGSGIVSSIITIPLVPKLRNFCK